MPCKHSTLPARVGILLAVVLGLVLTQADGGHALSIGAQATFDFVIVPPTPENPFGVTSVESFSCFPPGVPCRVTSRYAVLGTSQDAISAQFQYAYDGGSPYSIMFAATDSKGRLLTRVRAARAFGDEFAVEATSCGPQSGSCVSFTDSTGLPLDQPLPSFPFVSREEFESRAAGGLVTIGSGLVPFYLPVGPRTSISAEVALSAGISVGPEPCRFDSSECHSETRAGFTLIALPPPGATFIEPVPEPATLLLFGTTAAGLGLVRWRQSRRKRQP